MSSDLERNLKQEEGAVPPDQTEFRLSELLKVVCLCISEKDGGSGSNGADGNDVVLITVLLLRTVVK